MGIKEAQAKEKLHFISGNHSKWQFPNFCMSLVYIQSSSKFMLALLIFLCLKLLNSPTYNITITQISVGAEDANIEFSAIFDSGTSFTYLNDPAYTQISETVSTFKIFILTC